MAGCRLGALGAYGADQVGRHALSAGSRSFTVRTLDGRTRSFIVFGSRNASGKRPLVLVYHGAGDTAAGTEASTDFAFTAKQHGLVVAFMQGYANTWNEGAGNTPAHAAGVDDVQYTEAVIGRIEQSYSIDTTRIAATGFSNGALLTQLLGCRLATRVVAIIPVEGQIPASISAGCRPRLPISVLEVHGTDDTTIPYAGGHFVGVGGGTTVLSAVASAARWAALDRCAHSQKTRAGSIRQTTYSRCRSGVVVDLHTIVGGRHRWPTGIGLLVADFLHYNPRAARGRHSSS